MEREGSLHIYTYNASLQANYPTHFFFNQNKVHTKITRNTVARSKMGLMSTLSTVQWAESV